MSEGDLRELRTERDVETTNEKLRASKHFLFCYTTQPTSSLASALVLILTAAHAEGSTETLEKQMQSLAATFLDPFKSPSTPFATHPSRGNMNTLYPLFRTEAVSSADCHIELPH